uniref:Uncharacterized protein n=1 Tax=viral metagenome TaxID=1070528 RepID=A0A6C0D233_9ZZZZ
MIQVEEVPYAYINLDISNIESFHNDVSNIPVSVEVVPHKAYLIDEPITHSGAYLNFHIFRLSQNRINRNDQIRGISHNYTIQRIKCVFYTIISIPITIILIGYISTIWDRS